MKSIKYYVRKTHRYLGLFIGIQLLFWSVGGLYFSWTNIDEIHGDHLVNLPKNEIIIQKDLLSPDQALNSSKIDQSQIKSIVLESIDGVTFYRIQRQDNSFTLVNARKGSIKNPMSKEEAIVLAQSIFIPNNTVKNVAYITAENIKDHWQYRGGDLPAWAVTFDHPSNSVIYLSAEKGTFEKIRNKQWRIFDYLWMLHIMDFEEREDINNSILRIFSILSLLTVFSGFILFYQSSRTIRKL